MGCLSSSAVAPREIENLQDSLLIARESLGINFAGFNTRGLKEFQNTCACHMSIALLSSEPVLIEAQY